MRRRHLLGLGLALPALALSMSAALAQGVERVAIVMPGSISDNGWNQAGFEGLRDAGQALGFETAFSENVEQPEQISAINDYARRGYDLVIGHGGEFQDAVERIAQRYPETMFMVNNGLATSENVATADFYFSQLGFLMGYVAGGMTRSGTIGIINAQEFKFTTDTTEGYRAGAAAARPDVDVLVTWTGDWDDVAKGKEAALNQIAQGADVVWPTLDSATLGAMQAVQEEGAYGIGIYRDAIGEWPEILQSAILDVRGNMRAYLDLAAAGELEGRRYRGDLSNPQAMRIGSFHPDIPAGLQAEVEALAASMAAGDFAPQPD